MVLDWGLIADRRSTPFHFPQVAVAPNDYGGVVGPALVEAANALNAVEALALASERAVEHTVHAWVIGDCLGVVGSSAPTMQPAWGCVVRPAKQTKPNRIELIVTTLLGSRPPTALRAARAHRASRSTRASHRASHRASRGTRASC